MAYYGELAFNSQKISKPTVPLDKIESLNTIGKHPLPYILLPEKFLVVATGNEPLCLLDSKKFTEKMRNMLPKNAVFYEEHNVHEFIAQAEPLMNLACITILLAMGCFVMMFVGTILELIIIYFTITDPRNFGIYDILTTSQWIIIPYLGMKIFLWLTHKMPDNSYTFFNRRTGCISIQHKKNRICELPFVDFDPYVQACMDTAAGLKYTLWYKHKSNGLSVAFVANTYLMDIIVQHNYLRQFMDISKPLPDIPKLEPFRQLDPVTAEYDKKTGRQKDFWQSKSKEEIKAILKSLNRELEKVFPDPFFYS